MKLYSAMISRLPSVQEQFQVLERKLGGSGRLGISAMLMGNPGEIRARIDYRSDERFPMASVIKVPVAMAVEALCQRDELSFEEQLTISSDSACPGPLANPLDRTFFSPRKLTFSKSVGELLELMLVHSDNTAADTLLARIGGLSVVQSFIDC